MFPRLLLSWLAGVAGMAVWAAPSAIANPSGVSPVRAATSAEQTLLSELLHRTAGDLHRWAYTEHRVIRDSKGRVKSEVLLRFDPSKPYPEQWTPLKIDGKEPSERERARYRRRGERSAQSSDKPIPMGPPGRTQSRKSLGELLDLSKVAIASETATHLVFEIPLMKVGNERFPPEKFTVFARMRKEGNQLENVSAVLRESFRSKVVVKVKSGEGSIDFAVVDPRYPPTLVGISGDAVASVLFVNIGGSMELKRTELRRVKPYEERFDVQIGTLKAIDF